MINEKTKAIIINSPNNPTGVIYSEELLKDMASIIEKKEKEFGTDIYIVSDEPYAVIRYDNIELPNVFNIFKNSIIANSFSKSLGLAGERIGYLAVNSKIEHDELLVNALIFANRTLGFVNAPAIFQKVIGDSVKETVDVNEYLIRRNMFYDILTEVGFECVKPQGAFYLFPKAPIDDDVEFVMKAKEFNILAVPGSGFGCPGYFRLSYCIGIDTIENSKEAWKKLAKFYNM
jgi:aspartate aminotransferase